MDLAEHFLALIEAIKNVSDELNCISLAGGDVLCTYHLTKAALAEQSYYLVLISDLPPDGRQVDLLRILTFHD